MNVSKMYHAAVLLLALSLVLGLAGCAKNEDLVAQIGSTRITLKDLRNEMVRNNRNDIHEAARLPLESRELALDQMIEKELKLQLAHRAGYYERPEFVSKREELLENSLVQELYNTYVFDAVITDEVIRDTYERQGVELQASHILLKWKDDSTSVRQRAVEIRNEIENGLPFADAATKYTEEPGGADRKGDLGWFTWGRMVMPFQEACWNLSENELSPPVETAFGVHLIKLTGRRVLDVRPSLEEIKPQIISTLQASMRDQLFETGTTYTTEVRDTYHQHIDEDLVNELTTAMNSNIDEDHQYVRDVSQKLLESGWAGRVMATWDGGSLPMEDFVSWCYKYTNPRTPFASTDDVRAILENAVMSPMLVKRAFEMKLDQNQDVIDLVQTRLDGLVLTAYRNDEMTSAHGVSEAQIEAYYNEHTDEYMDPAKVRVQEVYVTSKETAEDIARRAKSGSNFSELAREYTERPGKAGTDGSLEPFAAGRYDKMGEVAFELKPGEISDPIQLGRAWVVIKKVENIPSLPRTLDQCKTQIRMKLEREAREAAQAEWRAAAEKQISVKTWPDKLKRLFAEE